MSKNHMPSPSYQPGSINAEQPDRAIREYSDRLRPYTDEEKTRHARELAEALALFRAQWNSVSRERLNEGKDASFRTVDGAHVPFTALQPDESETTATATDTTSVSLSAQQSQPANS
jgi:hypothetical protein